jgi:hypothetical protein
MSESLKTKVGYRTPPKQFQFKKGVSGNPSGKRRGTTKQSLDEIVQTTSARIVDIDIGGKVTKCRVDAALARALVAQAMNGHAAAVSLILDLLGQKQDENNQVAAAHAKELARREWFENWKKTELPKLFVKD